MITCNNRRFLTVVVPCHILCHESDLGSFNPLTMMNFYIINRVLYEVVIKHDHYSLKLTGE